MRAIQEQPARTSETEQAESLVPASQDFASFAGRWIHWALLVAVFGFLAVRAALQFTPHWDTMMYHLPSALTLYGLTTYEPDPIIRGFLEGIPHGAHFVQGFLVLVSGRMSAANLINLTALAISAITVWRMTRGTSALRWYLTALLAVPLVILHADCSYIDLWNGSFLATGFVFLVQLFRFVKRGSSAVTPVASVVGCLIALGISFNSKYQSWPFNVLLWGWLVVGLCLLWKRDAKIGRKASLSAALLIPIFLVHPAKNAFLHGNPTHPIYNPLMAPESSKMLQNPSLEGSVRPQTPIALWGTPNSLRYAYSAFEINRLMPSKFPMIWSLDSGKGYPARNATIHYRMGGWFFATVLILLVAIAFGLRTKVLDWMPVAIFASCAALPSILTFSHALRYWLFIPIAASYLAAEAFAGFSRRVAMPFQIGLAGCAVFVCWTVLPPFTIDTAHPADYAPENARKFWVARAANMDGRTIAVSAHPYSMFWAGPEFNTFKVREIRMKK